jgi:putative heme-binding domain-containing protein
MLLYLFNRPRLFPPHVPEEVIAAMMRSIRRSAIAIAAAGLVSLVTVAAQSVPVVVTGDPAAGKALFDLRGGCLACHSIDHRGGRFGPDLSWIGMLRTPESLRRSLVDPDAQIDANFFTVVVETKAGQTIEGLAVREDDLSIQIDDRAGDRRSFLKSDLKSLRREKRSLMPSYASRFSAAEIDHLVAYLRTLRSIRPSEAGERTRTIAPVSENVTFFDRPRRDAEERTDDLVRALEIREGAKIADIGAGTGYFTWRLAQRAGPAGKVIAVDIQQKMLDLAQKRVSGHGLLNVDYVLGSETDPKLPERSLDMVLIAYSYHEFAQPETIMEAVRRSLKPHGRLVIVEYAKESRLAPASSLHKMTFDEIRSEIEPMGFDLERILDFLPMQHGLIFTVR